MGLWDCGCSVLCRWIGAIQGITITGTAYSTVELLLLSIVYVKSIQTAKIAEQHDITALSDAANALAAEVEALCGLVDDGTGNVVVGAVWRSVDAADCAVTDGSATLVKITALPLVFIVSVDDTISEVDPLCSVATIVVAVVLVLVAAVLAVVAELASIGDDGLFVWKADVLDEPDGSAISVGVAVALTFASFVTPTLVADSAVAAHVAAG